GAFHHPFVDPVALPFEAEADSGPEAIRRIILGTFCKQPRAGISLAYPSTQHPANSLPPHLWEHQQLPNYDHSIPAPMPAAQSAFDDEQLALFSSLVERDEDHDHLLTRESGSG